MLRVGRITVRIDQGTANRVATDEAVVVVAECVRRILNRATILCPVDHGNLRAHHKFRVERMPPGARGEVYNDADYAEAVHNGSGPYTIRPKREMSRRNPKRKAMLKFEVGGRTVFARSVRHPGTRARPWLARAGQEVAAQTGFRWEPGR